MEDLHERLMKVETIQEVHTKKLDSQLEKNEALIELKTLMSIQVEDSKKRDRQMEKFSDTLDRVNDNLTNLNVSHNQMRQDMNEIGERVSDIEKYQEGNKIDSIKLFKGILSYVATGIGSIAIAYLTWLLTK